MTILEEMKVRRLFCDGGMGSLLQAQGLKPGELPETWNLTRRDVLISIHRSYLEAGADIMTTNTFGANRLKFKDDLESIVTAAVENARTAVREAGHGYVALDLGPTKWYMIRTILLPSAMPGILTGIILAIGRIVGESAALLFTAGSGYYLPKNLFSKIFESGGTLTIQLYLFMQKAKYNEAFGVAVVLLVIVLGINGLAKYMSHRFNVEARRGAGRGQRCDEGCQQGPGPYQYGKSFAPHCNPCPSGYT